MSVDVDVVVPNCLRETEDGSFWGYDKNNWQETEQSLAMQKDLDPVSLEKSDNVFMCRMSNSFRFRIMSCWKVITNS